jgi:hypothetical protein
MPSLLQLLPFIKRAAASSNPMVANQAALMEQDMQAGEDEQVVDSHLEGEHQHQLNADGSPQQKDELDQLFLKVMPEIKIDEQNKDVKTNEPLKEFGGVKIESDTPPETKLASAFIRDAVVSSLPSNAQDDIAKFSPTKKAVQVIQYGMVVKELLPKVDRHNFDVAEAHIKREFEGKDVKKLKAEFHEKSKTKFILILNDSVIDGHHFLAKAKQLNITSSLNVLDLTPIRFQEKKASARQPKTLLHQLRRSWER